jgi:hypothetical protein
LAKANFLHSFPINKSSPLIGIAQLIRDEHSKYEFHEFVVKCGRLVLQEEVANLKMKENVTFVTKKQ